MKRGGTLDVALKYQDILRFPLFPGFQQGGTLDVALKYQDLLREPLFPGFQLNPFLLLLFFFFSLFPCIV